MLIRAAPSNQNCCDGVGCKAQPIGTRVAADYVFFAEAAFWLVSQLKSTDFVS